MTRLLLVAMLLAAGCGGGGEAEPPRDPCKPIGFTVQKRSDTWGLAFYVGPPEDPTYVPCYPVSECVEPPFYWSGKARLITVEMFSPWVGRLGVVTFGPDKTRLWWDQYDVTIGSCGLTPLGFPPWF